MFHLFDLSNCDQFLGSCNRQASEYYLAEFERNLSTVVFRMASVQPP